MANIRDIAARAGVSVATVSRVLSNPEKVRSPTVQRVNAAIQALNYTPNAMASSLRRKRSNTVIVAVEDIQNPFYSGIVQGIESRANEHQYRILLGQTKGQQARVDSYAELLRRKFADGLIIVGSLVPTGFDPEAEDRLPLVLACEYGETTGMFSVRIDNVAAASEAVGYLVALGHRRIATIAGPDGNRLADDRLEGYRLGLERAGLGYDEQLVVSAAFDLDSGMEAMQRLLSRERPTAVFCANDEIAMGAIRALKDAGLSVPEDCAIVGFDDIRFAAFSMPPLTTVSQPNLAIGETAMTLMVEALADQARPREVVLPHRLVVRRSTAPIRTDR